MTSNCYRFTKFNMTSQNTYRHQLEIHTMELTCSSLLPAQTETHMKSTMSQRVQVVCVYISSLSLQLTRAIFRPPIEDRRRGELITRSNVGKVLLRFYLNCSLDRENSLYKAFKLLTKNIGVVHFLVTNTQILCYTPTPKINYKKKYMALVEK